MKPLLQVAGLSVDYLAGNGTVVPALRDLNLEINAGETVGILGESGSGKSSLALALLRLLPANTRNISGEAIFESRNLLKLQSAELRKLRGAEISLVFQEPALALNPVLPVGVQIRDVLKAHGTFSKADTVEKTHSMLRQVGFDEPEKIAQAYPSQISGGQRQRVAIAQALVCHPRLLIADEPLSSLDTVTQAEVLALLQRLKDELNLSILFITHNAGVLAAFADRVAVMHRGQIVACGRFDELRQTSDPYVQQIISPARIVAPALPPASVNGTPTALLQVRNVTKRFRRKHFLSKKVVVEALQEVDLTLHEQSVVALVGRSGSGKSTLARCIAGFETPDSGEVLLDGTPIHKLTKASRQQIQLLFQDATTALNPRFTAGEVIAEPLGINHWGTASERRERVRSAMKETGLDPETSGRPVAQFSGGQRQRLAIARALVLQPRLLILDEALSGLDTPLQAQIVRMLLELQARHRLTYLYISHDLNFVSLFAHKIMVMQQGRIVESATPQMLQKSSHLETRALLEASQRLHVPGMEVAR